MTPTDDGQTGSGSPPGIWVIASRPSVLMSLIAIGLVVASISGPWLHRTAGGVAWLALLGAWTVLVVCALRLAVRVTPTTGLYIILAGAAAMRLALVIEPPYLSSDMYRYVWDGRVQGAGLNPYTQVPAAAEVEHLRDAAIYPNINRADYAPTIYPPAAQIVFWAITRLGDGIIAMKLGMLVFEALAIAGMIGLLRQLALPPTHVVAYAWHPLPVWEIAGNGHVEAVLLGLMVASLWLLARGRTRLSGCVASVAVLVKPTALLLMPVLWRPWDWKLPAILVAAIALLYAPYLSAGWKVLGFLGGYVAEEGLSTGDGFRYLGLLQGLVGPIRHGALVYMCLAGAILAVLAIRIGFRQDRSTAAAIAGLGLLVTAFLVLLTPHYPWYYLALGPWLALQARVTPWVLMSGGFLLYDVVDGDRMPPFALREGTLHLTALAALAYDTFTSRAPAIDRQYGASSS